MTVEVNGTVSVAPGSFKDLLSGEVPITFNYVQEKETYLETGQLTALAVTGRSRVAAFPGIREVRPSGSPRKSARSWLAGRPS